MAAAPAQAQAQAAVPVQVPNTLTDFAALRDENFAQVLQNNPDALCTVALREIGGHNLWGDNYDVNTRDVDAFVRDLRTATIIINNSVTILKKSRNFDAPLETADQGFISYLSAGPNDEFSRLSNDQKTLVKNTIYNLFKNQLLLMAILLCKTAGSAQYSASLNDFMARVLEKLQALNQIKRGFIESIRRTPATATATTAPQTGGNYGSSHNNLLNKCLYKAYKQQYMMGKKYGL